MFIQPDLRLVYASSCDRIGPMTRYTPRSTSVHKCPARRSPRLNSRERHVPVYREKRGSDARAFFLLHRLRRPSATIEDCLGNY